MGVTQCWCGHLLTRARNSPGHRSSKGTPTSVRSNVPHVSHVIKVKSTCFFFAVVFFLPENRTCTVRLENFVDRSVRGQSDLSDCRSHTKSPWPALTPHLFACFALAQVAKCRESVCHRGSATCQLFRAEPEDRECDGDEGDHHHHDDGGGAHMHRCHTWPADTGVRIDTPFIWHKGESVVVL
jgi:hypothetical protein